MHDEIVRLRLSGLSTSEIAKRVGLCPRTVRYKLSRSRDTVDSIIKEKVSQFNRAHNSRKIDPLYKVDHDKAIALIKKVNKCYLSGRTISIPNKETWSLDHKNPKSKGGANTIKNMGVSSMLVNRSKQDMTVREFITMCRDVLVHHGYSVRKK